MTGAAPISPVQLEGWRPTDTVERRSMRARLHRFVRSTSSRQGARDCMVAPRDGNVIKISVSGDTGRAHVSGLKRCGSPWACPCCTPKVRQRRATELLQLVTAAKAAGGSVLLVTATLPHRRSDPLADLLNGLSKSWSRFWSGRWSEQFRHRWHMVGSVRAVEITYGTRAGWHPHVHALLFFDTQVSDADVVELWAPAIRRWQDTVQKVTGRRPDSLGCFDVRSVDDPRNISGYVTDGSSWTIGAELAAGPAKLGRVGGRWSPLALLGAAAVWGDVEAAARWHEYDAATMGRRAIVASAGLYETYGVREADDAQAAEGDEATNVAGVLDVDVMTWNALAALDATDAFLLACELWMGSGPPPDPAELVRVLLATRRLQRGGSVGGGG